MFFPESLDNKSFRLLVQRTWMFMQRHIALSSLEKQLAFLIEEHPEIGIFISGAPVDIRRRFGDDEFNPFLFLAAIWQVYNQIDSDKPSGIRKVVESAFGSELTESEIRARLARIYLDLYEQEKIGRKEFDASTYVEEVTKILQDPLYFEEHDTGGDSDGLQDTVDVNHSYYANLVDQAFSSLGEAFHKEASTKPIQVNTRLQPAMNKLPVEWVDAMAVCWQRPALKLKRDRIKDLCAFLRSDAGAERLAQSLDEDEKDVLKFLIENDGSLTYKRVSKKYGDEIQDGYWWLTSPPTSVIGRLRYKGLVYVGKAQLKTRHYKMIILPRDLIPVVKKALSID